MAKHVVCSGKNPHRVGLDDSGRVLGCGDEIYTTGDKGIDGGYRFQQVGDVIPLNDGRPAVAQKKQMPL